ncbi:RNase P modulator RnpM [Bacillus sp. FJAT-45037]|uniref:RNase P modulator RnpM n=1 Tax=Bacillus sp. FJAT-45037 TaxID=2011007 RepID=UPI000C24CE04|nr:YlxR family protein [Bacillus sp. FJAT-45037]
MKQRKVPLRKCIVTNEMKSKHELVRIVRTPEGEVVLDHTGKKNGRGAYLSNTEDCFKQAKKKDSLSRHLQVKLTEEQYDQLDQDRQRGKK